MATPDKVSIHFWSIFLNLVILTSVSKAQLTEEELTVNGSPLGTIQGIQGMAIKTQKLYRQFLGIPFAEAPVTDSRFIPATTMSIPLVPNGQIFYANKSMDCCPQSAYNLVCINRQSENCLGLNIYAPVVTDDRKLPVIVFIHGGGFIIGSGDSYGGERLLERDVILVSPNYRLGILGYFSLTTDNTHSAPGNAGMFDLVEALAWVKNYISYFGGDVNSITIAGQSAGSVAVTHLMLSPLSRDKGYFHKAIAMSGTALNEWGTSTAQDAEVTSIEIARRLGCPDSPTKSEETARCMREFTNLTRLVQVVDEYQHEERSQGRLGYAGFSPIIQTSGIPFLDQPPLDILEAGQQSNIPLLMGTTRHDGSFVFSVTFNQFLRIYNLQNNSTFLKDKLIPMVLQALGIDDTTGTISETLKDAYLGPEIKHSGNFTEMIPGLTDLHSVFFYKAAAYKTMKLHSKIQPNSFWYSFDYRGPKSVYSGLVNTEGNPIPGGITHGDDLIYLFMVPPLELTLQDELVVSERLVNIWANFAETGNPGDWPRFSEDDPKYVSINTGNNFVDGYPNEHWIGLANELWQDDQDTTTTEARSGRINQNNFIILNLISLSVIWRLVF